MRRFSDSFSTASTLCATAAEEKVVEDECAGKANDEGALAKECLDTFSPKTQRRRCRRDSDVATASPLTADESLKPSLTGIRRVASLMKIVLHSTRCVRKHRKRDFVS